MKTHRPPQSPVRRLTVSPVAGLLLASTSAALLPVCVHTVSAATRTYAIAAGGNFSAFPDTGQPLLNGDFTLFNGAGNGAATTVNSNIANLRLGTGVSGSTIQGNAIAFGLPANRVPTPFTILQSAAAPSLNIAGNIVNNSGIQQVISSNLVETLVPKANGVNGYQINATSGNIVINGTIGTGTITSPGTTADLRKYGAGTLFIRPPVSGGNNLGTDSVPNIGSLVDFCLVSGGTLVVDAGATLAARNFASVGYVTGETGALTINGAYTGSGDINIGDQATTTGTVTINAGGSVSCSSHFVGKTGNGTMYMEGGDFTVSGYTSVGTFSGSQGNFVFDGGNYTVATDFNITDYTGTTGSVTLNDGFVQMSTLFVGKGSGGNGTGTVGTLIQNGGFIIQTPGGGGGEWRIGGGNSSNPQARGTYNMNGGALQTNLPFQVGAYGIGVLNQTGGELALNSYTDAGRFSGGVGTINVTGGTFNQADSSTRLFAGEEGTGTINVGRPAGATSGAGGTVIASGGLVIGYKSTSTGVFNLNAGGLLRAAYVSSAVDPGAAAGTGTSTFNFNGGTLQAYNSGPVFNNGDTFFQSMGRANVQAGGAIIDTGNQTVSILQSLLHDNTTNAPAIDGGLTKLGSGVMVVYGFNTYTGPTLVSAGNLQVYDNDSFGGASSNGSVTVGSGALLSVYDSLSISRAMTVNAGGTLTIGGGANLTTSGTLNGGGTINGSVTIANGGTLSGPLTINGALTINSGGRAQIVTGGTLQVNGNLVNNGTMLLGRGTVLALGSGRTFTNNGTLDVSTGSFSPPAGFVNRGVVIDSSVVRVRSVTRQTNGAVTLTINTYTGHNYRFQRASTLGAGFADVAGVAAQAGSTGTTASFTDPNPPTGSGFYRIVVDP